MDHGRGCPGRTVESYAFKKVLRQPFRCRVIERQCCREDSAKPGLQTVAEFDRIHRVEALIEESAIGVRCLRSVRGNLADLFEDVGRETVQPFFGRQHAQLCRQTVVRGSVCGVAVIRLNWGTVEQGVDKPGAIASRQYRQMGQVERGRPIHRFKALRSFDRSKPVACQSACQSGVAGGVGPGTPADTLSWKPATAAIERECIQHAVCGSIGGLTRIAEQPARRGNQHEMPDRMIGREAVECPAAHHLRRHHGKHTFGGLLMQDCIVQNARGMEYSGQRWPMRRQGVDKCRKCRCIGDIDGADLDLDTPGAPLFNSLCSVSF